MSDIKWFLFSLILIFQLSGCQNSFLLSTDVKTPFISSVSTENISSVGNEVIVLNGKNFDEVTDVRLNGSSCTALSVTANTIECTTPASTILGKPSIQFTYGNKLKFSTTAEVRYVTRIGDRIGSNDIDRSLNFPYGMSISGQKMVVSENANDRVLIWNTIPTSHASLPDVIIGLPTLNYGQVLVTPATTALNLESPVGVWTDGTKLAIADTGNHRVLLWNQIPATQNVAPDVVLGQPDFVSNTLNNGPATAACGGVTGINACSLRSPHDVLFADNKFIVTDKSNNRILIWDGWPTSIQQPADHVVGQSTFLTATSNAGPNTVACGSVAGRNSCSLLVPAGLDWDGTHFIVADSSNNRVLIFNGVPLSYGTPANLVLGQPGFTTGTSNNGSLSARSLSGPLAVKSDGTRLFVSDTNNNRILGWSAFPTSNFQVADIVLGQNDFLSNTSNKGLSTTIDNMGSPRGLAFSGASLWGVDRINNRLLHYADPSVATVPDRVWGHNTTTEGDSNIYGIFTGSYNNVTDANYDGEYFIVTDRYNNRVIIQSGIPYSLTDVNNRVVLGQPNDSTRLPNNGPATAECDGVAGVNRCSLSGPLSSLRVGNKLIVSDYLNRRVLIWNSIPTVNQQPADVVLGQPNFTTAVTNNGPATPECGGVAGINACSFSTPNGMASNGTNLIVSDHGINRVLIWNQIPTTNQAPADLVLGQPDFLSSTANNGPNTPSCDNVAGRNRCSFNSPYTPAIYGDKLVVTDYLNHRVLIWNIMPYMNQQPADVVIGQNDFISGVMGVAQGTFKYPIGACVTSLGRLVVADSDNNRLLVFNRLPTTNAALASRVIGQSDFESSLKNHGSTRSLAGFNRPFGVKCYGENVLVGDSYNGRVMYHSVK